MSRRQLVAAVVVLLLISPGLKTRGSAQSTAATGPMVVADYERALALQAKYTNKALNVAEQATWLASGKVWYRKSVTGGNAWEVRRNGCGSWPG